MRAPRLKLLPNFRPNVAPGSTGMNVVDRTRNLREPSLARPWRIITDGASISAIVDADGNTLGFLHPDAAAEIVAKINNGENDADQERNH